MVAYNFKPEFIEPIRAGTKGGTIRNKRAGRNPTRPGGHAFAGERLRLYTGMRTARCMLIADKVCIGVAQIGVHFEPQRRVHIILNEQSKLHYRGKAQLDEFAKFDGFTRFEDLEAKLKAFYGPMVIFHGWHIRWLPLPHEVETFGEPEIIPLVAALR